MFSKCVLFFAAIVLNQGKGLLSVFVSFLVLSSPIEPPFRFLPSFFAPPIGAIFGEINKTLEDTKTRTVTTSSEEEISVNLTEKITIEVVNGTTNDMETVTYATDGKDENIDKENVETKNDTEATTVFAKTTNKMDENFTNNSDLTSEVLNRVTEQYPTKMGTKVDQRQEVQSLIQNRNFRASSYPNENLCKPSCNHYPNSPPYPCQHVAMCCTNPCQHMSIDSPSCQPPCCLPPCNVPPILSYQNPCQYIPPCCCLVPSSSRAPCTPPSKPVCQNPSCPCGHGPVDPCDSLSSSPIVRFFRSLSKLFNIRMEVDIPINSEYASPQIRLKITEGRRAAGYDEVDLRSRRGLRV